MRESSREIHETTKADRARDWHVRSAQETLQALSVDPGKGLEDAEAARRLEQYGGNTLPAPIRRGPWSRFALQFHNPLIYVLLASGAATCALADYVDTGVIFGVVLINAVIGFIQEGKAETALEAVRAMLATRAMVVRDGERHEVDAARLVPGDIVLLESGARIPADLRLIRARNLFVDEASLTGESVPVEKDTAPVAAETPVADRSCMAYSGTTVCSGQARGVVVGSGQATEIGRIGKLVGQVQTLATPLTRRLDQFARQATLFILAVGLVTFLYGHFVTKMPMLEIFLAVVGLAVAAIPEGLPAIMTIVLAIGTRVIARNNGIVRSLPALETLGSVTVICSDKTGTLTRNEMTAVAILLPTRTLKASGVGYSPEGGFFQRDGAAVDPMQDRELQELARCALLCNDAHLRRDADASWQLTGDPTEGALLTLARKAGLDPLQVGTAAPRADEIPFESEHRFMATLHHDHAGRVFALLKGAPERVLDLCVQDSRGQSIDRADWGVRMEQAAADGQRLLCLATCDMPPGMTAFSMADIDRRFTLLGIVGFIDPPRLEAVEALEECRRAGIQVKMVTGDHAVTAMGVGRQLGLTGVRTLTGQMLEAMDEEALRLQACAADIIARAGPEHKLRLVTALQSRGEMVAMTGDGVNDAPALKAADIGVAMGHKGTDAAREASDLVLTDDNFATIVHAVREGRVVMDNIKKSLLFILPTNGGESAVILLAVFAGLALPVTASQILWVNTVTTVTLALALAFEPAERDIMRRPPRPPSEPLITRLLAIRIGFVTLLMVPAILCVFEWELLRGGAVEMARTAAVNMLVFSEGVYLFNVRRFTASAFTRDILTANRAAFWMSALLVGLQILFTYAPPMQELFHTRALDLPSWLVIMTLSTTLFLAVEAEKAALRRRNIRHM